MRVGAGYCKTSSFYSLTLLLHQPASEPASIVNLIGSLFILPGGSSSFEQAAVLQTHIHTHGSTVRQAQLNSEEQWE